MTNRIELSCPCPKCLRCCCDWIIQLNGFGGMADECVNRDVEGVCEHEA